MSECRWNEGLSGSYCQTHFAYTEDMGVCHVADLIERAEKAEAQVQAVRELCDNKQREVEESDPLFGPPLTLTVPDVLRALGPVTETDCHGGDA